MNEHLINETLKEAKKSLLTSDVPIGAIIVKNNKIISRSHNNREKIKKITGHAEIQAIEKLNKKLKTWHLNDCIMYVSLEPCLMCYEAIIQSRISKVIYLAKSDLYGFTNYNIKNKTNTIFELKECNKSVELLKNFFSKQRNKKI